MKRPKRRTVLDRQAANNVGGVGMGDPTPPHTATELQAMDVYMYKPVLDPPYIEAHHRLCTYNKTRYVSVKLPGCRAHVNPIFTFPVAISCECSMCSTENTECETF
ncbi:GPHB5 protein, partial [Polypterus senegalus]